MMGHWIRWAALAAIVGLGACKDAQPPRAAPVPAPTTQVAPTSKAMDAATTPKEPTAQSPQVVFETRGGAVYVDVEVARAPEELQRGLMYRRELAPGTGMIFLMPNEAPQRFWMKNTYISLDMIFVNGAREVVGIVANTEPLSLETRGVDAPSRFVVEVPGGFAEASGIAVGDRMRIVGVEGVAR